MALIGIDPRPNLIRWLLPACVLLLPHVLHAEPGVDDKELTQLRSRIQDLEKELTSTEESKSEAADALRDSEKAISDANKKIATLTRKQRQARKELGQLHAQSRRITRDIRAQQSRLSKLLYHYYVKGGGQKEYLELLLDKHGPNEITRNLYYHGYFSRARKDDINALRANLRQLGALSRESHVKNGEIAGIQSKEVEQKKQLEQKKTEHARLLVQISQQADQQRREIDRLKRDEDRLARLVERITRELAAARKRDHEEPVPAAPPPPRGEDRPPPEEDRLPDITMDGITFLSLKGSLSLPVRGELANRFGSPRADGGVTWKGWFIRSQAGADVKAIATGQVVFADWLRGFGNLLILDHGGSYMSLYGNNEAIHRRVGDMVNSGDRIATAGNSGNNPDPGLYFELRHEGKPFDPANWVRIK